MPQKKYKIKSIAENYRHEQWQNGHPVFMCLKNIFERKKLPLLSFIWGKPNICYQSFIWGKPNICNQSLNQSVNECFANLIILGHSMRGRMLFTAGYHAYKWTLHQNPN